MYSVGLEDGESGGGQTDHSDCTLRNCLPEPRLPEPFVKGDNISEDAGETTDCQKHC